jgi:hypothetical protein
MNIVKKGLILNPLTPNELRRVYYGESEENGSNGKECPSTLNTALWASYGLSRAAAMGLSYSVNKSVLWAILHGLIGPAYLFYYFTQKR